jgi:hypothetical protein
MDGWGNVSLPLAFGDPDDLLTWDLMPGVEVDGHEGDVKDHADPAYEVQDL